MSNWEGDERKIDEVEAFDRLSQYNLHQEVYTSYTSYCKVDQTVLNMMLQEKQILTNNNPTPFIAMA